MTKVKLFAPYGYETMTDKNKKIVCNGCGSKGLGGFLVPNTLWGLSIEEACNIHDYMYDIGRTTADKNNADVAFLNNMLRVIKAHDGNWLVNAMRRNRAFSYFQAVQMFGGPAFWDSKNSENDIIEISGEAIIA